MLCIERPGGSSQYFKFIYSVIPPGYLALCHCQLLPHKYDQHDLEEQGLEQLRACRFKFKVNFAAVCSGEDLIGIPLEQVSVILGILYQGGTTAFSGCLQEALASYLEDLP